MSALEHSKNPLRYMLFHESLDFTCCLIWFTYLLILDFLCYNLSSLSKHVVS